MVFIWREISARALVVEMVLALLKLARFEEPMPTKTSSGAFLRASLTNWGKPLGTLEFWPDAAGAEDPPPEAAGAVPPQPITANITHSTINTTAIFFIPFYSCMISSVRTYVLNGQYTIILFFFQVNSRTNSGNLRTPEP
jgi:hypothetical protein